MKIYMEHANITVKNIDNAIQFFQTAFPHFEVRGGGTSDYRWVHLGTDETYIAINDRGNGGIEKDYTSTGINHIGFVVDNVKELGERLLAAGFERSYPLQNQKYRIRDYFVDNDGIEYEFVEYLSDKVEERNDYND
jgi:catechol 2,3-dioxygenase-like lactoylglutathione lyase family enzyme